MRPPLLSPLLVLTAIAAACADGTAPGGSAPLAAARDAGRTADHMLRGYVGTSRHAGGVTTETRLPGVEVEVSRVKMGADSGRYALVPVSTLVSGPDGSFELRGLEPGLYELAAKRPPGTAYAPAREFFESFREESQGMAAIYLYEQP